VHKCKTKKVQHGTNSNQAQIHAVGDWIWTVITTCDAEKLLLISVLQKLSWWELTSEHAWPAKCSMTIDSSKQRIVMQNIKVVMWEAIAISFNTSFMPEKKKQNLQGSALHVTSAMSSKLDITITRPHYTWVLSTQQYKINMNWLFFKKMKEEKVHALERLNVTVIAYKMKCINT